MTKNGIQGNRQGNYYSNKFVKSIVKSIDTKFSSIISIISTISIICKKKISFVNYYDFCVEFGQLRLILANNGQ